MTDFERHTLILTEDFQLRVYNDETFHRQFRAFLYLLILASFCCLNGPTIPILFPVSAWVKIELGCVINQI